jgi:signal transduction histidine kinase
MDSPKRLHKRLLARLFERLTLPGQVLLLGSAAGLLSLGLAQLAQARSGSDLAWMALAAALATAATTWPAWRTRRAHDAITQAAHALAAEAAPDDAQLPYLTPSEDLHRSTLALRRVVDVARRQRQALRERIDVLGAQLQSRTEQLGTLQDLSVGLARHTEMGALVGEALAALERTMAYSSASVWARSELDPRQPVMLMGFRSPASELGEAELQSLTGLRLSRANLQRYEQIEAEGHAIVENRPRQGLLSWLWQMVTDDARTSALYRSTRAWMAVPLKVRERVLGVLRVDHGETDYFDAERERLLNAVGSQTALAMRHAQLLTQQRDLAVTAERNRIARDLHDAVSQTLFAANILAGTLSRDEALPEAARGQVLTLEKLNRSALAEMRMMLFELRPDALETVRLPELLQHAIEALAGRGDVTVDTAISAEPGPPPALRTELYRIAQEALSNIGRHSGARHVHVGWSIDAPGSGRLHIVDDGAGFDTTAAHPGHFGLENMKARAASIGAQLAITSAPGEGTELLLTLNWT